MSSLTRRYPSLEGIARFPLTHLPTPVTRLTALSRATAADLWIKRDDLSSEEYGGNKSRKLELLLGDALARRADLLITRGSFGSHHALATAIAGRRAGLPTHVALSPEARSPHSDLVLRGMIGAGAFLHPSPLGMSPAFDDQRMRFYALRARLAGKRPYVIALGGTSPLAVVAHVMAAFELAAQVDGREAPWPNVMATALGSGSSAAGLAIGLALLDRPGRVLAPRIGHWFFVNARQMRRLITRAVALLRAIEPRIPDVTAEALRRLVIDDRESGPSFGVPSPRSTAAQEQLLQLEGLELDPTYTAKVMALIIHEAEKGNLHGPLLYWHTCPSGVPAELLERVPVLPDWIARMG